MVHYKYTSRGIVSDVGYVHTLPSTVTQIEYHYSLLLKTHPHKKTSFLIMCQKNATHRVFCPKKCKLTLLLGGSLFAYWCQFVPKLNMWSFEEPWPDLCLTEIKHALHGHTNLEVFFGLKKHESLVFLRSIGPPKFLLTHIHTNRNTTIRKLATSYHIFWGSLFFGISKLF